MSEISRVAVVAGIVLCLPGCLEDKQAEIDKLNERVADLEEEIEDMEDEIRDAEKDYEKLLKEMDDTEDRAAEFERNLRDAERDLAAYKRAEEREKERAKAEPSLREKLVMAKTKAEESLAAVVTVKGGKEECRGFVIEADGKNWLYTTASGLSGATQLEITTADDTKLTKFGAFEMAAGLDMVRLELKDEGAVKLSVGELNKDGRLIGVGKSGTSVVEGRTYGDGGDVQRVDSRIGGGLPGSPVFDGVSGELVGMLTASSDVERSLWPTGRDEYNRDQRELCLVGQKREWAASNIGAFLKEAQRLAETDKLTRLVAAIASIDPLAGGGSLSGSVAGGWTVEKVFEENPDMRVIKELKEIEEWLSSAKMKPSERDVKRRYGSVFGQVGSASRRQIQDFDPAKFSLYHREAAKQSIEWRKEAEEDLARVVKALGK